MKVVLYLSQKSVEFSTNFVSKIAEIIQQFWEMNWIGSATSMVQIRFNFDVSRKNLIWGLVWKLIFLNVETDPSKFSWKREQICIIYFPS